VADEAGNESTAGTAYTVTSYTYDPTTPQNQREIISLGQNNGQLIRPVTVEGKKYYVWDRNSDGVHGTGDTSTMDNLEKLFFGSSAAAPIGNTSRTYKFNPGANEVSVMLPTLGGQSFTASTRTQENTNVNSPEVVNSTYDDLLAIWDAHNGSALAGNSVAGVPNGWKSDAYWSATSWGYDFGTNAYYNYNINLSNGYTSSINQIHDYLVAFQVL
jgi:hypothetical protein